MIYSQPPRATLSQPMPNGLVLMHDGRGVLVGFIWNEVRYLCTLEESEMIVNVDMNRGYLIDAPVSGTVNLHSLFRFYLLNELITKDERLAEDVYTSIKNEFSSLYPLLESFVETI